MAKTRWMRREGGAVAATAPGLETPNGIAHVARMVPTPVGIAGGPCAVSAPCGFFAR